MVVYILKFSVCLLLFLVAYRLVLEKENMHVFKRFYLLGILLLSLGIPLITFTYYIEPITTTNPVLIGEVFIQDSNLPLESKTDFLPIILWTIYGLGVFIFGIKFIKNLYAILYKIKHNPKHKVFSITHVLLSDFIVPHTFFKYIFFNKQKFESQEIPQEVLWHEETHAKQKHSIDVLFIELLQVLFWFNPLIYLTKHVIKLNHEFLADQGVLNKGVRTTTYQETLLAFSSNASQPQLANAINYSLIKKRFTVMKTQTTKKGIWLRSVLLLPLLAITLFSFSDKVVIEKASEKKLLPNVTASSKQEKATKEQIKEYNTLAKKYNNMSKDDMHIEQSDMERLKYLYNLMTVDQRSNAEKFPEIPAPPAPPAAPKAPKAPKAGKPKMPPPPPLPANATKAQKKKYKEAYRDAQIAAKIQKVKAEKENKVRVKKLRSVEERQKIRQEKLAYKEGQMAAKNLKIRLQKEQLRQEKLAMKNEQMDSERLKLKLVREQMRQEKMANKENQLVAKRVKLKAEREQLAKVKRQYSDLERKKLRKEKEAYRKDLEKARELERKANKKRLKKIKEEKNMPRTPESASIDEREQLLRLQKEYSGGQPSELVLSSSLNEIEQVELREVESVPLREIEEVKVREIEEIPFEEIQVRELPPPPPPKSPKEHIKEMAENGAEFYFDGKSVSSKEAINLIRSNKDLNILTNHTDDTGFVVNLSSKPIVIDSQQ